MQKTLFAWGSPYQSVLLNQQTNYPQRVNIPAVKAILIGQQRDYLLNQDGTLQVFQNKREIFTTKQVTGMSVCGKTLGFFTDDQAKIIFENSQFFHKGKCKKISVGINHALLLDLDGFVYGLGSNQFGQIGLGKVPQTKSFIKLNIQGLVKEISCGIAHSLILKADSTLFACGVNRDGQLGLGCQLFQSFPKQIIISNVSSIASGYHSGAITQQGDLFIWGSSRLGTYNLPKSFCKGIKFRDIKIYDNVGFATTLDGIIYGWGDNQFGQLCLQNYQSYFQPKSVASLAAYNTQEVFVGSGCVVALCLPRFQSQKHCSEEKPELRGRWKSELSHQFEVSSAIIKELREQLGKSKIKQSALQSELAEREERVEELKREVQRVNEEWEKQKRENTLLRKDIIQMEANLILLQKFNQKKQSLLGKDSRSFTLTQEKTFEQAHLLFLQAKLLELENVCAQFKDTLSDRQRRIVYLQDSLKVSLNNLKTVQNENAQLRMKSCLDGKNIILDQFGLILGMNTQLIQNTEWIRKRLFQRQYSQKVEHDHKLITTQIEKTLKQALQQTHKTKKFLQQI